MTGITQINNEDYVICRSKRPDGTLFFGNEIYLVIGGKCSGKSTFLQHISEVHLRKYNKVQIKATDYKKTYENAYMLFRPQAQHHLKKLDEESQKMSNRNPTFYPDTEIYSPYSKQIKLTEKFPKTNFFTIPIKSFLNNSIILQALFEHEGENIAMTILKNTVNTLSNSEGYYDLLYKVDRLPEKARKEIMPRLKMLENEGFLMQENYEHNLDMKKIMNTLKYHCFVDKTIKDKKLQYLLLAYLFIEIQRNLEHSKYGVTVDIDEVRGIFPEGVQGYRKAVTQYFAEEILIALRNVGKGASFLLAGQVFDMINKTIRTSADQTYVGKVNEDTLKSLIKDYGLTKDQREPYQEIINEQTQGNFVWRNHEDDGVWTAPLPCHGIPEEGMPFMELYKAQYPDLISDYRNLREGIFNEIKRQETEYHAKKNKDRELREKLIEKNKKPAKKPEKVELTEKDLRTERIKALYYKHKDATDYLKKIIFDYEKEHHIKLNNEQVYRALKKGNIDETTENPESVLPQTEVRSETQTV